MLTNPTNMYLFKVNNRNTRKKMWNMFKVMFWCLYCKLGTYFSPFSSASIVVDFGHIFASKTSKWDVMKFQSSQPSVASHMETSHLICTKNQMVGLYTTRKTWLKWIKRPSQHSRYCKATWKKYGPKTLLSIEWDNSGKEYAN